MVSQDHILKLCVPPELHLATIKVQAELEIGRPFAGLLMLTEAAYQRKLISREVYDVLRMRYSRKLVHEESPKLTLEILRERQKLDEKTRYFSMVLDQWYLHEFDWRRKKVVEAEDWRDRVPNAQLVIDLGAEKK